MDTKAAATKYIRGLTDGAALHYILVSILVAVDGHGNISVFQVTTFETAAMAVIGLVTTVTLIVRLRRSQNSQLQNRK
ncbi:MULTISPECIES: hypothetical protein [Mycobacteroides]|jgi:hypothetical protein|uniref:Uncharacterized protein n=1 Tax=Mycobacteroides chelonae TaxID=1774 RepID=A0AB73M6Y7_MYCCH|nr:MULTISPECIES: hypothetical protein [Mycobacteroides]KRQ31284.1 hypothetical protein AOT86_01325 [Mycobacteroides sp. H072]KRQ35959.1 hypothetical protein AOT84_15785 [Mycobacteroides sp. H002]KRQ50503.1 hypothetical protein AOT85_13445 [Mycobacteroides sp. H054]MBN7369282.1 hypothetical protein [Mycobacteroides abscessus subsp. abscessus]MDM2321201.1 hypothetical protein [Mycobacteroides abscessus]